MQIPTFCISLSVLDTSSPHAKVCIVPAIVLYLQSWNQNCFPCLYTETIWCKFNILSVLMTEIHLSHKVWFKVKARSGVSTWLRLKIFYPKAPHVPFICPPVVDKRSLERPPSSALKTGLSVNLYVPPSASTSHYNHIFHMHSHGASTHVLSLIEAASQYCVRM